MNLIMHPEEKIAVINDYSKNLVTLYDLRYVKPKVIAKRASNHFISAANRKGLWLVYKESKKSSRFEDPVNFEIWNCDLTFNKTYKLKGERTWIQSSASSHKNQFFAFASVEESITLYDAITLKRLSHLAGGEYITGLSFSNNDQYLSAFNTFQGGGYIGIYQIVSGKLKTLFHSRSENLKEETPLEDFADTFGRTVFNSDDKYVFILATNSNSDYGNWIAELICIELYTGKCHWNISINSTIIPDLGKFENLVLTEIALNRDGTKIAIGLPNGKVAIFKTENGTLIKIHRSNSKNAIYAVGYEKRSNRLWLMDEEYQLFSID
ncbi:MAG: hypothetical protein GF383_13285 [Candidatus Lokiarchaeota archaeon]|nr:hypothetical protein [Candidatus Lokiarchaeota archaeon]MBD3342147.1 hypothetical protein [Candidatus Lokiarchaeota archaeon]